MAAYPDFLSKPMTLAEFVAGCLYAATQVRDSNGVRSNGWADSWAASHLSSINWGLES